MQQARNLELEQSRGIDLWVLLHNAEQIIVNHEYYHPHMHSTINKLMLMVEKYQQSIEHQIEQQELAEL